MEKYKTDNFFICTSEQENKFIGMFSDKGVPHQPEVIPENISSAVKTVIEKECEASWQNDHH